MATTNGPRYIAVVTESGDGLQRVVRDYRTLPPRVELEDTIASVDADPVPDPAAGRNIDQHRALRDD